MKNLSLGIEYKVLFLNGLFEKSLNGDYQKITTTFSEKIFLHKYSDKVFRFWHSGKNILLHWVTFINVFLSLDSHKKRKIERYYDWPH